MDRASSQRLLLQAKQGDRDALGLLLQNLRPYLRVLARGAHRGVLANRLDDSDLIQDAMVEVTRSFDRFQGGAVPEFLAWIRQVVSHTVHKSVRQLIATQKRNPEMAPAAVNPDLVPGSADLPDQIAELREDSARLAAAIERLPQDMQQVLLMRMVDDLPHAEIAARLGRTEQAVRMMFVRSVQRLRDLFAE